MDSHEAMKLCLEEMDVEGIRSLWHLIAPNMPQPQSDLEAMVTLHMARTMAPFLVPRQRYYSHRWLLDHGYPSQLPDHEKPLAERIYPQIVSGVGISVNTSSELLKPVVPYVQSAMENAVHEAYADGRRDDIPFIKRRMTEARETVIRKLLGRIESWTARSG
jgi:hypothetical protein